MTVLATEAVRHSYAGGAELRFPDLRLQAGEAASLIGPSGSGKSTLLLLIAGVLRLQQGAISIAGTPLATATEPARDRLRGGVIGLVLQSGRLLPHLSVLENLAAAQYFARLKVDAAAALQTLESLGIGGLAHTRPTRLSRGQAQRAAIARAVVNRPRLILADEPTSSLDDASAASALDLLLGESRRLGAALLIATHDRRVRAGLERVIDITAAA